MKEILDLYTETGELTGKTEKRQTIHQFGLWHKTAQLWILNSKNELLFQFRSADKDCFPSRWDVSSAGHIPAGDDILESALRELQEELGLDAEATEVEKLFEVKESFICESTGALDNEIAEVFLLRRDLQRQEITFCDKEVTDIKWIPVSKLWQEYQAHPNDFVPHDDHFKLLINRLS